MSATTSQIIFFKKNKADFSDSTVVASASQGSAYAQATLDRRNDTGWMTTGSVDADNTTFTVDMINLHFVTDLILVKHNFKSFTAKWWDGAAYQDFTPAIAPTTNTDSVSRFSFAIIQTTKIQITILGTQVANADKSLRQFIATEVIGQLAGWPIIANATQDKAKRITKMLSGKTLVSENVGGFSVDLSVSVWRSDADLTIVETLYGSSNGFLVWLCGGVQTQFSSVRQGYSLVDFFLMKCQDNLISDWSEGLYQSGMGMALALTEVTQ